MTLRTPYEFALDSQTWPYGEKQISVADPIGSAQGAHTFYLARKFNFDDGDYTFHVSADDAATVWIGTSLLNSRIIVSATLPSPGVATVHIPAGTYRIDVILTNLPVLPTPCYFALRIMRGDEVIYTSAKEGWNLDDAAISDDDLIDTEDPRFTLPVWSVLPDWTNGVVERLSWSTDVMESETDAEQRRSIRRNARRSFEASFLRQNAQAARMDAFFSGIGPAKFLMPMWHEQVKMLDGVDMGSSGVNFPGGELRLREFRKGDIIFVNNGDPDHYDLLQVGDVEQNRFSWAFPPPRSWPRGTRIFPVREARIVTQNPKISHITDTVSRAQVLFDCVEPYTIPASWGAVQGNLPLFHFKVDRTNPLDVEFSRKNFVLDNTSGVMQITDHGRFTASIMQASVKLFGRSAAYSLRQFLQAARGRAQSFYAPTFMQDIYPVGDIDGGTRELLIEPQGFRRSMLRPQPTRTLLAFQFRNGAATLYANITAVREVFSKGAMVNEILVLDTALPLIRKSELKRISFMCETRFDQDAFEIHHPTNGHAMIEVAVVLRQATNPREVTA